MNRLTSRLRLAPRLLAGAAVLGLALGALLIGQAAADGSNHAAPDAPSLQRASRAPPAAEARWLTDYAEARRLAKKSGKPILANFSGSDWCGWCQRLDREVFSTPTFARWAARSVVLLEVDFPRRGLSAEQTRENRRLAERYGVQGFPTVLFLDADGDVLGRTGYREGGARAWTEHAERWTRHEGERRSG